VKWLAGEGAGSWFLIEDAGIELFYNIIRYSPSGKIECEVLFQSEKYINLMKEFTITYPAHCSKVGVLQEGEKILLTSIPLSQEIQ